MKSLLRVLFTTIIIALGASPAIAEPYPLDYWAVRAAMSGVEVSPEGTYVAFMEIPSKTGNPIIKVYETADLSKEPYTAGGESLEVTGFNWISDRQMVVTFRGQVRDRIEGFNQGAYENRLALLNVESKDFSPLDDPRTSGTSRADSAFGLSFTNPLPNEPDKVLVGLSEFRPGDAFRSTSFYEFNLRTGSKRLVLRGNQDVFGVTFDQFGNPRYATSFDLQSDEFVYLYRKPGASSWTEIYRVNEDSFEIFDIEGYVEDDDSRLYVRAHNGNDKVGMWIYNADTKQFEDLIYRNPEVDVTGMAFHSNPWTNYDTPIAIGYAKEMPYREYFDNDVAALEAATLEQIEGLVPNSYNTRITSRSRDGNTLIAYNLGPKDPGSYYLLSGGKFQYLGGRKPLLKAEELAEVEYIQYPARDGRMIPAFVTVPNSEPPYPLVVLPHGGPFVQETIIFDEWSQLLANNGYMVLQPQYRGSRGYGLDFYTSAFINGGQGGYKMQDDKDDGALHLVREGLVDSDRIGFFGWSYGGYAALIAASREDQIYQCAIAGAAVADNIQQVNYYRDDIRGSARTEQIRFWDDSINPIRVADKVNIPLFIVHGDIDQRVPVRHARRYKQALDNAGISYKYVELEDADHFSNTLFYRHKIAIYEGMIGFFKNECGPGGL